MKYNICNMRITGERKVYILHQFEKFALNFDSDKIKEVDFGKQDIRGGFSICLVDNESIIPEQMFFNSKDELIGFVIGFNMNMGMFNRYERFLIKVKNPNN